MTNELETIAVEILRASQAAGTNVYAFVQAQAPDVVAQQVSWAFWDALITGVALFGTGLFVLWLLSSLLSKLGKLEEAEEFAGAVVASIVCLVVMVFLLSNGFLNLKDSFLIHNSPKAYIVQTLLKIKQ